MPDLPNDFLFVKFTYYKKSGKYYSEGEKSYSTELNYYELYQAIVKDLDNGIRPGLVDGALEFYCVVSGPVNFLVKPAKENE